MFSSPNVDRFEMCAVRRGNCIMLQGHYVAPSGGFTYTATTDGQLARPPHILGASINMLRPSRRLPRHQVCKPIHFSIPDPNHEATHVVVFLSVCGVFRRRMSLPISNA